MWVYSISPPSLSSIVLLTTEIGYIIGQESLETQKHRQTNTQNETNTLPI